MADADFELETAMTLDNKKFKDGLKRTEKEAEKSGKKLEKTIAKSGEQGFSQFTKFAADAVAKMGLLELGIKGVNAATAVFNGDMKEASEIVKQLPAGIGPVAQGLEEMLKNVTGMNAEMKKFQKEVEVTGTSIQLQSAIMSRRTSEADRLKLIEKQLSQSLAIEEAPDEMRQAVAEMFSRQNRRDLVRIQSKAVTDLTPVETEQLRKLQSNLSDLRQKKAETESRLPEDLQAFGFLPDLPAVARQVIGTQKIRGLESQITQAESAVSGVRKRIQEVKADPELIDLNRRILKTLQRLEYVEQTNAPVSIN